MTFEACGDDATNALSEKLVLSFLKASMTSYDPCLVATIKKIKSKLNDDVDERVLEFSG